MWNPVQGGGQEMACWLHAFFIAGLFWTRLGLIYGKLNPYWKEQLGS